MATKYENHITGDDSQNTVYGVNWEGQTFTPSTGHTVTSVKIKIWRVLSPRTITGSIRATSSSVPSGVDLCSGTTDGDTLPTTLGAAEWREITLGGGTLLTASTEYAICVRATSGDSSNYVQWRDDDDAGYGDGQRAFSSNSGTAWTASSGHDLMFEEWGGSGVPVVTTQAVNNIDVTTATGNGTITSLGNASVTQHGHCWDTSTNPVTTDSHTSKGTGYLGAYISAITSLSSNTLYYVRAYATNSIGTSYGANVTFTTATTDMPVVETRDCSELTGTTARGVGIIWDEGGSAVTEHGHCWATTINPDINDTKTTNGNGFYGAFTSAITGLTATTSYYIRAYATNTAGTAYGNNVRIIAGTGGSELAGPIAVVQTRLHYVDKYGVEKYIEGTPV